MPTATPAGASAPAQPTTLYGDMRAVELDLAVASGYVRGMAAGTVLGAALAAALLMLAWWLTLPATSSRGWTLTTVFELLQVAA